MQKARVPCSTVGTAGTCLTGRGNAAGFDAAREGAGLGTRGGGYRVPGNAHVGPGNLDRSRVHVARKGSRRVRRHGARGRGCDAAPEGAVGVMHGESVLGFRTGGCCVVDMSPVLQHEKQFGWFRDQRAEFFVGEFGVREGVAAAEPGRPWAQHLGSTAVVQAGFVDRLHGVLGEQAVA